MEKIGPDEKENRIEQKRTEKKGIRKESDTVYKNRIELNPVEQNST